ncbi:uncharacterized protein LOC144619260 [Crassostrea virginica]
MNQLREDCSKSCVIVRRIPPGLIPQGFLQGLRVEQKDPSTSLVMFPSEEQARVFLTAGSQDYGGFVLKFTASRGSDIPDEWLQDNSCNSAGEQMLVRPVYMCPYTQPAKPWPQSTQRQQHKSNSHQYTPGICH